VRKVIVSSFSPIISVCGKSTAYCDSGGATDWNGLLAVKNRHVRARWTVVGRVAEPVTPLRRRPGLVSLPRIDHTQHVPGVELLRLQAQRGEHLLR